MKSRATSFASVFERFRRQAKLVSKNVVKQMTEIKKLIEQLFRWRLMIWRYYNNSGVMGLVGYWYHFLYKLRSSNNWLLSFIDTKISRTFSSWI